MYYVKCLEKCLACSKHFVLTIVIIMKIIPYFINSKMHIFMFESSETGLLLTINSVL